MKYLYNALYLFSIFAPANSLTLSRKSLMYPPSHISPTETIITWNDGEVGWDIDQSDYDACDKNKTSTLVLQYPYPYPKPYIQLLDRPTPLYNHITDHQGFITGLTVLSKLSYKEIFNVFDSIFSQISNNASSFLLFVPSDLFLFALLGGVSIFYTNIKENELRRIGKLYKFQSDIGYSRKYKDIRTITKFVFIILTFVLTKNIQDAE